MSDARPVSAVVRRLRRAGVLLGCGVVMTVVVSWGVATWGDPLVLPQAGIKTLEEVLPSGDTVEWRRQQYSADEVRWSDVDQSRVAVPFQKNEPADILTYSIPPSIEGTWPLEMPERQVGYAWSDEFWHVYPELLYEVRSGWPIAAMQSRRVTNWDDEKFTYVTQCDGLEVPASGLGERLRFTLEGNSLNSPYRPVPLVPVWPGFAVCSGFWAVCVGAAWYVPGMVRGTMRRRRGLCGKCGYEVRGLAACPECGHAHGDGKQIGLDAPIRAEVTT